jgi:integrase
MSNYGLGGVFSVGDRWHCRYSNHGHQVRESTGVRLGAGSPDDPKSEYSKSELKARQFLQRRLNAIAAGKFARQSDRLTVDEALDAFLARYKMEGRRSLRTAAIVIKHVRRIFRGYRAIDVTAPRLRDYVNRRREEGAASSSIHRELAHLRTALKLAADDGRLSALPPFPTVKVDNARQGFVEPADFERLWTELPAELKDYARFLYLSGWRSNEGRLLEWRDVDLEAGEIKLRPENSKTAKPRTLPLSGELRAIIERLDAWRRPETSRFVFCRDDGRPIGDVRKAWTKAASRAGLAKLTPHDLRRSCVRNLVRAGVSQHVAQSWTGHATPSVFARYNITSSDDLRHAAAKLDAYIGTQQQKSAKVVLLRSSENLAQPVRKAG